MMLVMIGILLSQGAIGSLWCSDNDATEDNTTGIAFKWLFQ